MFKGTWWLAREKRELEEALRKTAHELAEAKTTIRQLRARIVELEAAEAVTDGLQP